MRLLGGRSSTPSRTRILNIHPSLLPSFPGVDAQRQAWEHGAKVAGATVHFVTGELDGGPIVCQPAVPGIDDDTPETLAARILEVEHRIYPEAVGARAERRLDDRRTTVPSAPSHAQHRRPRTRPHVKEVAVRAGSRARSGDAGTRPLQHHIGLGADVVSHTIVTPAAAACAHARQHPRFRALRRRS